MKEEDLRTMSIKELQEFCMSSKQFHSIKHELSFSILVTRLARAESTVENVMAIVCGNIDTDPYARRKFELLRDPSITALCQDNPFKER